MGLFHTAAILSQETEKPLFYHPCERTREGFVPAKEKDELKMTKWMVQCSIFNSVHFFRKCFYLYLDDFCFF